MVYKLNKYLLICVFVILCVAPAQARIPIPVGFGDQISHVYDLPDAEFGKKDIGYMYGSLRILFIPCITWGGKLVIYEGNSYADLDKDELAFIEEKFGKMGGRVGLWIRYVNFLWLILGLLMLFLWIKSYSEE